MAEEETSVDCAIAFVRGRGLCSTEDKLNESVKIRRIVRPTKRHDTANLSNT